MFPLHQSLARLARAEGSAGVGGPDGELEEVAKATHWRSVDDRVAIVSTIRGADPVFDGLQPIRVAPDRPHWTLSC
jgi:hypothetical protein